MLIGRIRRVESRTVELEGESVADIAAQAAAAAPNGWDVIAAPVRMRKGSTRIDATATLALRDGSTEIEADDMAGLEARVPDGWQLVSVRAL